MCSSISKGDDKFITTDHLQQCHFDDYLLPAEKFAALKREQVLPRRSARTATSARKAFAAAGRAVGHRHPRQGQQSCPMPSSPESGLKITRWMRRCRIGRRRWIDQTSQLLPRIKIPELLMDVDDWTGLQPPLHPLGRTGPRPKTGRCCCPQSSVMRSALGADQDGRGRAPA